MLNKKDLMGRKGKSKKILNKQKELEEQLKNTRNKQQNLKTKEKLNSEILENKNN